MIVRRRAFLPFLVLWNPIRLRSGLVTIAGLYPSILFLMVLLSGRILLLILNLLLRVSFPSFMFSCFYAKFSLVSDSWCSKCHIRHWNEECPQICTSSFPCSLRPFSTESWPCRTCADASIFSLREWPDRSTDPSSSVFSEFLHYFMLLVFI